MFTFIHVYATVIICNIQRHIKSHTKSQLIHWSEMDCNVGSVSLPTTCSGSFTGHARINNQNYNITQNLHKYQ